MMNEDQGCEGWMKIAFAHIHFFCSGVWFIGIYLRLQEICWKCHRKNVVFRTIFRVCLYVVVCLMSITLSAIQYWIIAESWSRSCYGNWSDFYGKFCGYLKRILITIIFMLFNLIMFSGWHNLFPTGQLFFFWLLTSLRTSDGTCRFHPIILLYSTSIQWLRYRMLFAYRLL